MRQAVTTLGACAFQLTSSDTVYRATLLPADAKLLVSLLHKHAVPYRAQGPPGWRAAMVLLVPFAYLGVCGWLLHRMTSGDGPLGGGSAPSATNAGAPWTDVLAATLAHEWLGHGGHHERVVEGT